MRRCAALALALAACSPAADNTAAPVESDPAALPAPELDGAAALAGSWSFAALATGAEARFATPESSTAFSIRCDIPAGRRIVLFRNQPGAHDGTMRIIVGSGAVTLSAQAADVVPGMQAAIPATDTFLAALAGERGRIGVIVGGTPAVTLPAGPEVARVLAACRP